MRLMQTGLVIALVATSAIVAHAQRSGAARTQSSRMYTSIRQVNFKNFTYHVPEGNVIRMRRGAGKDGEDEVSVDQIAYGDLTGDGREEAVVLLGGRVTGNLSYYTLNGFIVTLENGQPKVLTTFEGGDVRGSGGAVLDPVRIRNGVLSIGRHTGSQYDQVYIETRKYRWDGSQLVEIEKQTRRPY